MICLFLQESLLRHPFSKAMEAAETTPGVSGEPSCLTLPSRRHTFTYPIICIPNAFLNKGKSINYSRQSYGKPRCGGVARADSACSSLSSDWATKTYSESLLSRRPLPVPFLKQQVPFGWCAQQKSSQASPAGKAAGHINSFLLNSGREDRIRFHFSARRENEYSE